MKWRAISSSKNLCCWNGEFVVFNGLSGDTHLLSEFAGQVLLKLQQAPLDAASLYTLFSAIPKDDSEQELGLQIDDILADLDSLLLIERV
ncbi:MAG: HPr-rel-A system PqqD family peptide chaperone [Oxalobacteraceae bacterium]